MLKYAQAISQARSAWVLRWPGASDSEEKKLLVIQVGPCVLVCCSMATVTQFAQLASNTRITLGDMNPHRLGTESFKCYESYKHAQTIDEAKKSGASIWNLRQAYDKGLLQFVDKEVVFEKGAGGGAKGTKEDEEEEDEEEEEGEEEEEEKGAKRKEGRKRKQLS